MSPDELINILHLDVAHEAHIEQCDRGVRKIENI